MQDISEFKIGTIVTTVSGFKYKTLRVEYIANGKTQIAISVLLNLETNKEITATHHKNKCFKKI